MSRNLLLLILFLTASITLSFGQSSPELERADNYAILAYKRVVNFGNTDVYGNLGSETSGAVVDNGSLRVFGDSDFKSPIITEALRDAQNVYDQYINYPNPKPLFSYTLGNQKLEPGVYKVNRSASLIGGLTLDGQGDPNAVFVIIIEGDLTSSADKTYINLINGAQPKNVFWIIKGAADTGKTSLFQGTVIARDDIKFGTGGVVIGRAISLTGEITLDNNLVFMPNMIIANLSVQKEAEDKEFILNGEVTYTIRATNLGPDDAKGVVVREEVPAGLELIGVPFISKGTYDQETNHWFIGNLAVNEIVTLKLTFKIVNLGSIKNKVVIIGENPDPSPDEDEDEVEIIVSDIGVTKELVDPQETYYVGDMVRYKVTVKNYADLIEKNVKISEQLAEGLQFIDYEVVAAGAGTYDHEVGIIHIPALANKGEVTFYIRAKLIKAGEISNVVSIISKDPVNPNNPSNPDEDYKDSDPGNNDDKVVIPEVQCRPNPEITISVGPTAACAGAEGLVFKATTDVIGGTYTWTLPAGWRFAEGTNQNSNEVTLIAGPDGGSKTISVTVKDQCNQYNASDEVTVNVTGTPDALEITGGTTVCFNSDGITLSAATVEGLTYKWTVDETLEIVDGKDTEASVVVRPKNQSLLGGKVYLTVTNGCDLSSISEKVLTVTPAPATPISIIGDATVCAGKEVTFRTAAIAGATSYTWTLPTGWAFADGSADNNTNEIVVVPGTTGGTLRVTANIDACNISSAAAELEVSVTNVPVAPVAITGAINPCIGTQVTYTVADAVEGAEYVWTLPTGWSFVGSRTGSSITVKVGTSVASGEVTAAEKNECFTGPAATLAITPNKKPETPGSITVPGSDVCAMSTGNVFSIEPVDGATSYTWTLPAGWRFTEGTAQDGPEISVVAGTAGGTITVKASNACGDSGLRSININVLSLPTLPTAIVGNANVCEGASVTYEVPVVAGVTYNWNVPTTGGWQIVEGNGTARVTIKIGAASGSVELTVTNSCGTNSASVSLPVNVTNLPEAPVINGARTTACIGEKLTFSIEAPVNGLTYTWTVPNTWAASSTTGTSIEVTVGEGSGDITVFAKNQCGDGAVGRLAVSPTLPPATPGNIISNMNVCLNSTGNAFSITAVEGATSYEWEVTGGLTIEGDNTGTSITVAAAETGGEVRVRAIGACGMSDWSVLNVNLSLPPAPVTLITDNSNVCDGLIFTADPVEGATSYTWTVTEGFTIESGQGTTTIKVKASNVNATGRVSVIAYNGSCEGSAEYSIEIDAKVADGQLDFPKAFSPNGDGKNDTWLVKNLEKFPDNDMVIFNRWGSEVFKQKNYKNDWAAKGLEQGTYFYKVRVKLCDGVYRDYSGYITIFR
ncbi:ice-binding family protein [uncultured Pontibacter sp.]|uniref:ice-binding family protein n=1 Tax=uncultured Pontibacter sp. TaxID=453356 RepID=UPI002603460F|nr:ice-binding family protein [uncultured Pontibacter sp.]